MDVPWQSESGALQCELVGNDPRAFELWSQHHHVTCCYQHWFCDIINCFNLQWPFATTKDPLVLLKEQTKLTNANSKRKHETNKHTHKTHKTHKTTKQTQRSVTKKKPQEKMRYFKPLTDIILVISLTIPWPSALKQMPPRQIAIDPSLAKISLDVQSYDANLQSPVVKETSMP